MLVTVAEQCEQRIMNIREEEKQGIVLLVAMYVSSLCEIYRKKVAYCLHHCYQV